MSDEPTAGTPDSTPASTPDSTPATTVVTGSRISSLFDLRYVIGGLLGVYGVVLVIRGLLDGPEQIARAADTAINLWTGIGLVVVAAVFLVWARVRPLGLGEGEEDMGTPPV